MYTFDIQVKDSRELSAEEYKEIITLCTQAFKRDYTPYMKSFPNPVHILGKYNEKLVTHVLWITRWLQVGTWPLMRTAYIEALATDLEYQNKGFASEIMRKATGLIGDYDIAGLATGSQGFYTRLGWQSWRGPLFLRKDLKIIPTPEEHSVMVLPLRRTPPLDLNDPLSIEWREIEP